MSNKIEELREKLAAIEHERWADWMKYLFGECYMVNDGDMAIPADLVKHWQRQIDTPYKDLQHWEKESDMKQVDRYWPLIEAELTEARIDELKKSEDFLLNKLSFKPFDMYVEERVKEIKSE